MSECPREGKWLGCKFEARYDEEPNIGMKINRFEGASDDGFRRMFIRQKYVCDVCIRCGKTVERSNP